MTNVIETVDSSQPHIVMPGVAGTLHGGRQSNCDQTPMVAEAFKPSHYTRDKDGAPSEVYPPLSADADRGDQDPVVLTHSVRRLTPRECERLQGFPDDWTAIKFRGKPASDTARYRAIGNSMAVPVMAWIGERLKLVQHTLEEPDDGNEPN